MPIKVLMPALSPTMEKGNLAKWLKSEGDSVKPGDVLAEIETDKATMEVEAVDEGTLAKIVVPEGTSDVPVNDLIALIAEEGEDPAKVEVPADGGGAPAKPQNEAPNDEAPKAESKAESKKNAPAAPPAMSDAAPAPSKAPPVPKTGSGERIFASPLARRIAKDAGLDLKAVKGSGPHGRIIERDVRAAIEKGVGKAEAAAPAAKPEAPKA
ncbi:biotin/lipoyl-containing protein, partial [Saliniramus sp.]|uniref:biotin/lipoyl-containing protein n=1 Tax=Saliniramus sp. TaxID=2986772 RepID=UPI002B5BED10